MQINIEQLKTNWFETEEQFQAYCIKLISQEFPQLRDKVWHTQNEQYVEPKEGESTTKGKPGYEKYLKRCMIIGNQNKARGKLAGVMDILILFNGILYKIELKQPNGKLSEEQARLHAIWENDCPSLVPLVAFTPYTIYIYCKWIVSNDLKINFPPNFKKFEL